MYATIYSIITLLLARALIQLPSANSDLLIFAPSRSLAPLFVVTVALSDPAKSIRLIFPCVTSADKPALRGFWFTKTYNYVITYNYAGIN